MSSVTRLVDRKCDIEGTIDLVLLDWMTAKENDESVVLLLCCELVKVSILSDCDACTLIASSVDI